MRFRSWLSQRLWFAALVLALAFVGGDAVSRIRQVEYVSAIPGDKVEPPALDASSPTGYALGRRVMIVPGTGGDGYHWIVQTQQMLAGGGARIRHVDYDNAPAGREVHWASPYRWWLGALAYLHHVVSHAALGASVDWAALRSNPLLLAGLILGVVPLVAWRFGGAAASLIALGLATAFPFNVYFAADYPDHHGIIGACAFLSVLCLVAGGGGFVRVATPVAEADTAEWLPGREGARRWFAASAAAAGLGLWVSAASMIPVLGGIAFGALACGWVARVEPETGAWRRDPTLWRHWGFVGAAVSLGAYLAEYFPSHLGLRLEVNHPLYALAWAGGGELLCRGIRLLQRPRPAWSRRDVLAITAAAVAVLLPPLVILATKERTFRVADRYVWELGAQYVSEGESLVLGFKRNGFNLLALGHFLPLLLIVPPIWVLRTRDVPRQWKALVALAQGPALVFLLLTLREIRWWGMEVGLLLAAIAPVFVGWRSTSGRAVRWLAVGCGVLLLPGMVDVIRTCRRAPTPGDVRELVERDVAHWLRQRAGAERVVVACTPGLATQLIYFGGCDALGTLYWENTDGLKAAAAILAARTPEEAHDLIRQHGITHLVLPTWDPFAENFVRFQRELPATAPVPEDTFLRFLLRGGVPPWLRLLPYRLPAIEALQGQRVLIFEVVDDQRPAAAAAHLMDYLLEMDDTGPAAAAVARQLGRSVGDLQAQVTLACYLGQTNQGDAFVATLRRMGENLGQAPTLDVEDQLRLVLVLAAGQQTELARAQLRATAAKLDERTLRRLTPGSLSDLLRLGRGLGVEIPDTRLRQLAVTLLPPPLRAAEAAK